MKIALQYVNDINGNIQAVQLPLTNGKSAEQTSKIWAGIKIKIWLKTFEQVAILKKQKGKSKR